MRISDCSSDVCPAYLDGPRVVQPGCRNEREMPPAVARPSPKERVGRRMDESIRLGGQAVLTVHGPARLLSRTSERAVFLTLVVLMIVPLWLFTYYPSTDGPVHLNIATIMNGYDDPDASRIRAFFRFNGNIEPNVVAHHLIAALDAAAGDILVAEKIFLTLWVLLFR